MQGFSKKMRNNHRDRNLHREGNWEEYIIHFSL